MAPELVAELGEPYGRLWQVLVETYGAQDGARVLSRVIGAVTEQGVEAVGDALERALEAPVADRAGTAAFTPGLDSGIGTPQSSCL